MLIWVFILLAASFDNIWNFIEYVINLGDISRDLSKTFDIWVERHLTIFNDNLVIWRYLMTETFTLEPENYHPEDIVKYCHLLPSGNRALEVHKQDLLYQFAACDYRINICIFSKYFQILHIFGQILEYFALFKHFFTLFLKNRTLALTFNNRPW